MCSCPAVVLSLSMTYPLQAPVPTASSSNSSLCVECPLSPQGAKSLLSVYSHQCSVSPRYQGALHMISLEAGTDHHMCSHTTHSSLYTVLYSILFTLHRVLLFSVTLHSQANYNKETMTLKGDLLDVPLPGFWCSVHPNPGVLSMYLVFPHYLLPCIIGYMNMPWKDL